MNTYQCVHCSAQFNAKGMSRRFCSRVCYWANRYQQHREVYNVPDGLRRCSKCKQNKVVGEFYTQGVSTAGWCKSCRCADEKIRRANPVLVAKFRTKYETDMDFRARELLRATQKRCRARGIAYDLDIAWLSERMRGCCELTGLPFDHAIRNRRRNAYSPSIDRIVPGGGYTKDNCRVVLYAVNAALNDWTLDVLLPIVEALLQRHCSRAIA